MSQAQRLSWWAGAAAVNLRRHLIRKLYSGLGYRRALQQSLPKHYGAHLACQCCGPQIGRKMERNGHRGPGYGFT